MFFSNIKTPAILYQDTMDFLNTTLQEGADLSGTVSGYHAQLICYLDRHLMVF